MAEPKKKLAFPALNSVVSRPLFAPPVRGADEEEKAFEKRAKAYEEVEGVRLRVRLVGTETANEFHMRLRRLRHEERMRRKEAGRPVVSSADSEDEAPETEEGELAWKEFLTDVCVDLLIGIDGVLVGDVDSETITDTKELLRLLDLAGWRAEAAIVCLRAQAPDVKSVFC